MMVLQLAYAPGKVFDRLRETDIFRLALFLMAIRWSVTSFTTVLNMYYNASPMFLSPPFGIDPDTYRFYEIFWYGLYGIFMMFVVTLALFLIAKRLYHVHAISFRKTFGLVALCFFTPWVPSVLGDYILVMAVNAHPLYLVPFHVALILTWECYLVGLGFHRVFDTSLSRGAYLGFVAGATFVALGALLIR